MAKFYQDLGLRLDRKPNNIHFNKPRAFLIQKAIETGFGKLSKDGSLIVETGKHTGRSANDRYIVKSEITEKSIWWENNLHPMSPEVFSSIKDKALSFLNTDKDLYITERSVGAHEKHNVGARLISTHPSHALFSTHLFRDKMREFDHRDFTILHAPEMELSDEEQEKFKLASKTCIVTCFDSKTTIIFGTLYAGEIKKSMFSVLNFELPESDILPMHSGANRLENNEVSVFFGLSGTGKTTLSTDEGTLLIGDDEHGMSDEGVFNFEGGCYAKTFKLSKESEPGIYAASNRFGAMLENVVLDQASACVDFDDKSLSENGRSSYPLSFIDGLEPSSKGDVPKHIFFLTADAFGVLPPVSRLSREQAMFYFVLGYTAKLAGTEIGVKEPQATFSPCFGAPFMLRHPSTYANLLGHYVDKYNIKVWLINTGWTAGGYGVGERFPLSTTRQIIRNVQANKLNNVKTEKDPIFGLEIPMNIEGINNGILNPQKSWESEVEYIVRAKKLASDFHQQMKTFGDFYHNNIEGAPTYNG